MVCAARMAMSVVMSNHYDRKVHDGNDWNSQTRRCVSCPAIADEWSKTTQGNPRKIVARCKMMLFVPLLMTTGSYRRYVDEEILDWHSCFGGPWKRDFAAGNLLYSAKLCRLVVQQWPLGHISFPCCGWGDRGFKFLFCRSKEMGICSRAITMPSSCRWLPKRSCLVTQQCYLLRCLASTFPLLEEWRWILSDRDG